MGNRLRRQQVNSCNALDDGLFWFVTGSDCVYSRFGMWNPFRSGAETNFTSLLLQLINCGLFFRFYETLNLNCKWQIGSRYNGSFTDRQAKGLRMYLRGGQIHQAVSLVVSSPCPTAQFNITIHHRATFVTRELCTDTPSSFLLLL